MFFFRVAQFFQGIVEPCAVVHMRTRLGVLLNSLTDGQSHKRLGQIHRFAVIGQQQGAHGFFCSVTDQAFGELHQVLVVPIGRVKLHHGEFGVVANRNAFIAEVAVDLEHPLEAADQQAFQIQLRRDAQKHFLVQRIVVGGERPCVRTTGDGVQHGRFDFQKAVLHHELSNAAHGFAAGHEALA